MVTNPVIKHCDACGRSEVDDIARGTGVDLIPMTYHDADSVWICEYCEAGERHGE